MNRQSAEGWWWDVMADAPLSGLIEPSSALLMVIDLQEKLVPHIHQSERVVERSVRMIRAARILGVPVVVTEQYPRGLGSTVAPVLEVIPDVKMEKTTFGCLGTPAIRDAVVAPGVRTVILVGIEAHVCVLQTALQAVAEGLAVHVVRDAVSSRTVEDAEAGLARMSQAGATVTTSEMTILELVGDAKRPEFRQVLPLVK